MSYDSATYIELEGAFGGGLVDNTPNTHLDPRYSPFLRNCRLDGQSVVSRPGHELFYT